MKQLFNERLNRRSVFKIAGGMLVASIFDIGKPGASASATRMRWVEQDLFPESGLYQSPVFEAAQEFNSVEVGWSASQPTDIDLKFAVRTSGDGKTWSNWVTIHTDAHAVETASGRTYGAPVLLDKAGYVQYRVDIRAQNGATLNDVEIGCVDTSPPARLLAAGDNLIDNWIISRAGWGADENHRSSDWTPRYQPIEKVILHHTVTENNPSNPKETIRAIYYYHAVTLNWGDIGYNFLVDWQGNVYEGRYGGPDVVGAHALQYNWGSLGIAVLGNFDTNEIPQAALDSIVRLINQRAPNVDPAGLAFFIDKANVPNICGHGDLLSTDCPGSSFHEKIPHIRGWCKGTGPIYLGDTQIGPTTGQLVSVSFRPDQIHAGTTVRVDAVVRNSGSNTMYTQGPEPGYIYNEHDTFETTGFIKIERMYRVGVDFRGNSGVPNPYRWGLPGPLAPGEETTVTGFIRLDSVGNWTMSGSLVNENIRYDARNIGERTITVLPPPTERAARSSDPTTHYFDITGHNVPEIFHSFWERNGGIVRLGYPLTEPMWEVSETDGNTYLTQYFERARFEHHPENAGTKYEVLLGLLGSERTKSRKLETPFLKIDRPAGSNIDYFTETRHSLRSGFRDYWWKNGGVAIFGFPISEEFSETSKTDGHTYVVQYFERNRFEWHPELRGTEHEILLGHLGREILIDRGWITPSH